MCQCVFPVTKPLHKPALIYYEVMRYSLEDNSAWNAPDSNHEKVLENITHNHSAMILSLKDLAKQTLHNSVTFTLHNGWTPVGRKPLTHLGRVTHIRVGNLTIIGPDNGLLPSRRQAIIWTNAGILLIGPSGTNFSEILIEILTFSFTKMRLKVSSAK